MSQNKLLLSLGDIIQIIAPTNTDINNHIFLIKYLDNDRIQLIDATSSDQLHEIELNIKDGKLGDETIQEVAILQKAPERGFARQHKLLPEKWINIYFGGQLPTVITGQIMNLDEDMIEVETYPSKKRIFIDFGYKGIPLNIPIEKIIIRKAPIGLSLEEEDKEVLPDLSALIKEADEIVFDDGEEEMVQVVEVPEEERRFGISIQSEDMLDELLAHIPTQQRTSRVLNNIHIMIERFKQLRQMYSIFDEYDNPEAALIKGADYKPLVHTLQQLNQKLSWIIPIVKNKRKLYDIYDDDMEDIIPLTLAEVRQDEFTIVEEYKQNKIPHDENKYVYLMNQLYPYMIPFVSPTDMNHILVDKAVQTDLNVVVNNLEEFNSTVFGTEQKSIPMVHKQRFVIEAYTRGLTKLDTIRESITKTTIERRRLTPNNDISILSFLTFPAMMVEYSRVHLPKSSILLKTELSHLNMSYYLLLNRNSTIQSQDVDNHDNFLGGMKEIIYNSEEDPSEEKYRSFLESFVPKTRLLFNNYKQHIHNPGSYINIIDQLEPFMIYPNDISYKQYVDIVTFLDKTNTHIKKEIVTQNHKNERYQSINFRVSLHINPIFKELNANYNIVSGLPSEKIYTMLSLDGARAFTLSLALNNINLHGFLDIDNNIESELANITQRLDTEKEENTCNNYVLAKRYIELDELRADNGVDTFYDKQYDITRYRILDEFKNTTMDRAEFNAFLIDHLQQNIGMSADTAMREAEALQTGKRKVVEGEYAMLVLEDDIFKYYKRVNNRWELAEELEGRDWTDIFCNLQRKCLRVNNECNDNSINASLIKKNALEEILSHYENENKLSKERLEQKLTANFEFYKQQLHNLLIVEREERLQNNKKKTQIGMTYQQKEIPVSPYRKLLNLILAQSDFPKKQNDIITFVSRYCRIGEGENESAFWYYDADLGIPLLPTFLKLLADAFIENRYSVEVEKIAATQGKISDSGDAIVDKHSGYEIKKIDYVILDAYDEKGFRIVSRELLAEDEERAFVKDIETRVFNSEEAQMIYNIIITMSRYLSISVDSEVEFIIKNVLDVVSKIIPSKKIYEQKKKKKKARSYEHIKGNAILLTTLCYLIITIQTMTPSIIASKTFPGCKRSFKGYPYDGDGNMSFLTYISCIVNNISLKSQPWITLKRKKKRGVKRAIFKQESIQLLVKNLHTLFEKQILKRTDVKEKIRLKEVFLSQLPTHDYIPEEHNIRLWVTFLPPLRLIRVENIRSITTQFVDSLRTSFSEGNNNQFEKISIIQGKIIMFSMAIIQSIQRVINKEAPLLTNANDEPFLENVCCNEGSKMAIKYFSQDEPSIEQHNNKIIYLSNILKHAKSLYMAPFLYDPRNTKWVYPPLSDIFSEKTIYKAFIRYCQFNSGIPLSETLQPICVENNSAFLLTNTFEEKMAIMKSEGRIYSLAHLYQLLNVVEKERIVHMDLGNNIIGARTKLEAVLDYFQEINLDSPLLNYYRETLEFIDIQDDDEYEVIGKINNFVNVSITTLKENIYAFIEEHSGLSSTRLREIRAILDTLEQWKERGDGLYMRRDDETHFFSANFFKNNIMDITSIYPTIIMNAVDYQRIPIPSHWKLSPIHRHDIENIIRSEFGSLQEFYEDDNLNNILERVYTNTRNLLRIINVIPFFARTRDTHILFGGITFNRIMSFYYLTALNEYILQKTQQVRVENEGGGPVFLSSGKRGGGGEYSGDMGEIVSAEREMIEQKISLLISQCLFNFKNNKKRLNLNNTDIHDKILRRKEKEKKKMTDSLKALSHEQRAIENLLKTHRLGRWSVGMTRALFEYDEQQYDKERQEIEKDALLELELGKMDDVTEMNMDIYKLDLMSEKRAEKDAWREATDLSNLAEDDDYGEGKDGDEGY